MIPLRKGEIPPVYQREAISWLDRFKNAELLQQLLTRFYFPAEEIAAYRSHWKRWLKPKDDVRGRNLRTSWPTS